MGAVSSVIDDVERGIGHFIILDVDSVIEDTKDFLSDISCQAKHVGEGMLHIIYTGGYFDGLLPTQIHNEISKRVQDWMLENGYLGNKFISNKQ